MKRAGITAVIGGLLLLVVMVVSMTMGVSSVSLAEIRGWATHSTGLFIDPAYPRPSTLRESILVDLRLPRVLMAALVGAILAVCGVVMQAITRNDLAEPYLLGISAGASTGAVVALIFSSWQWGITGGAAVGALLAFAVLMGLIGGRAEDATRLVLTGVLVGFLFDALTQLITTAFGDADATRSALFWLLGVLGAARWDSLIVVAISGAIGLAILWMMARYLDAMSLGGDIAYTMGVPVKTVSYVVLVVVSLLTAATVSAVGAIGFIGLIVPHAIRIISGPKHQTLIPLSALAGAIFLVIADAGARVAFAPQEIPVGVITALIGVPLFFVVLRRKERQR